MGMHKPTSGLQSINSIILAIVPSGIAMSGLQIKWYLYIPTEQVIAMLCALPKPRFRPGQTRSITSEQNWLALESYPGGLLSITSIFAAPPRLNSPSNLAMPDIGVP
jgi:hypothetical protein